MIVKSNNINYVNIENSKFANAPQIKSIRKFSQNDSISFSSRNMGPQNTDAWYLKDSQIVEQDAFSTTIIDKSRPVVFGTNLLVNNII